MSGSCCSPESVSFVVLLYLPSKARYPLHLSKLGVRSWLRSSLSETQSYRGTFLRAQHKGLLLDPSVSFSSFFSGSREAPCRNHGTVCVSGCKGSIWPVGHLKVSIHKWLETRYGVLRALMYELFTCLLPHLKCHDQLTNGNLASEGEEQALMVYFEQVHTCTSITW